MHQSRFARRLLLCLISLLLLAPAALAQRLAEFTPAGSLLVIGFWEDTPPAGALKDELLSLDWDGARATFEQLAGALGGDELGSLLGGSDEFLSMICPDMSGLADPAAFTGEPLNGLLNIGFSPFNPMPATTGLLELSASQEQYVASVLEDVIDCLRGHPQAEVHELDQDGVPFWQLVIDYELSVSVSLHDGVLALSSNPDQLRHVLRLQGGSEEPSFAGSSHHGAWAALERGSSGIDWLLDYTVLADLAELFGAGLEQPELAAAAARSLRTAGVTTGSLSFTPEGLVYVSEYHPDRDGGDSELFSLLLSEGLTLPAPPLSLPGAVLHSSQLLNVQGAFGYLQGWLDRISVLAGEDLDLRELAAMAGIDLDVALLDWIGNDMHVVQLDTSAQLGNLLRGPGQVAFIGTTDSNAAETGVTELLQLASSLSAIDPELDVGFAVDDGSWRGISYTRVRVGPLTETAYTLLDGYLVIGSPASSLHRAIDAHLDGTARPAGVQVTDSELISRIDYEVGQELRSIADLTGSFVQPLAWALRLAAVEEVEARRSWDSWDMGGASQDWSSGGSYGYYDLSEVTFTPLALGETATGTLIADDPAASEAYFLLEGLSAGMEFSVRLESETGDGQLELIEAETGEVRAYNDDYEWPDLNPQIDFTAAAGQSYIVRANLWGFGPEAHEFSIALSLQSTEAETEEDEPALTEVPSFGQLLDAFELLPRAIRITSDRTGILEGTQVRSGDVIRARYVLHGDW